MAPLHDVAPQVATTGSAGAAQRQTSTKPTGDSDEDDEDNYAALKPVACRSIRILGKESGARGRPRSQVRELRFLSCPEAIRSGLEGSLTGRHSP